MIVCKDCGSDSVYRVGYVRCSEPKGQLKRTLKCVVPPVKEKYKYYCVCCNSAKSPFDIKSVPDVKVCDTNKCVPLVLPSTKSAGIRDGRLCIQFGKVKLLFSTSDVLILYSKGIYLSQFSKSP